MITCVCLVVETESELLLVQARNRAKYYFPGGKIDDNETLTAALVRELEEELLAGKIDLIVHSLKDLPTTLPNNCCIGAILK